MAVTAKEKLRREKELRIGIKTVHVQQMKDRSKMHHWVKDLAKAGRNARD